MPFVNSTLFSDLFTMLLNCLPWFETKNKIRCIDAPNYVLTHRNLPESEKYIWIIQNVPEKSRFFYISLTPVSAFTETVEFLQRSLASLLMRYCCSRIGCLFFSRQNRFAETHSHLQLSYHMTDRLLAACNNRLYIKSRVSSE